VLRNCRASSNTIRSPPLTLSIERGINKAVFQLDLRVNLIQNVSAYAFDGLSQLTRLSLAGNYIRKFEKEMWTGLDSLKEVDLGWNEITELSPDAFSPLSNNLMTLNLRHNPLKTVPPTGLKNLRALFLSECPLENIGHELLKDYPTLEVSLNF
ncbi:leucine Rich repeat-containing domain protein, partial [Cooperia oncophora]